MAPDTKTKKRKSGGAASSPSTKKIKKAEAPVVEEQPTPVKSTKKSKKAEAPAVEEQAAPAKPSKKSKDEPKEEEPVAAVKPKSTRKRASDFYDAEEKEEKAAEKPAGKKSKKATKETTEEPAEEQEKPVEKAVGKKSKKATKEKIEEPVDEPVPAAKAVNGKKRKATKEPAPAEESSDEEEAAVDGSDDESDAEDDQTAALLKGFESDEDEEDGEDEGIVDVPAIPDEKKLRKKLSKAKSDGGPGVIYVGRIPHGFYEHQMKAYFSQFGQVSRVRVSRNKKTGRSKHYAFVEFSHVEVARIVAETMDKYLMFGHILQVRFIPAEQVHPDLFKGSNRRFKPAPRNKMQGRHLRLGMDREAWDKRIEREEQRRKSKVEKLNEMDYTYDAPALKTSSKVPKKSAALPEAKEDAPKALTETPHDEEDQEVAEAMKSVKIGRKTRQSKKAEDNDAEEELVKVKATKDKKDAGKEKKAKKEPSKPKSKKAKTSA